MTYATFWRVEFCPYSSPNLFNKLTAQREKLNCSKICVFHWQKNLWTIFKHVLKSRGPTSLGGFLCPLVRQLVKHVLNSRGPTSLENNGHLLYRCGITAKNPYEHYWCSFQLSIEKNLTLHLSRKTTHIRVTFITKNHNITTAPVTKFGAYSKNRCIFRLCHYVYIHLHQTIVRFHASSYEHRYHLINFFCNN